jgi:hypothetical protein
METFLASFDSINAADFAEFFPRTGHAVYRHTRHTVRGSEVVVRTFPAAEIPAALQYSRPLWASFQFQFEEQPVGLLTQQVMLRTGRWGRVGEFRFVPPGADADSPTYVEWRREGQNWVISEYGDETFVDVPLPSWMVEHGAPERGARR